MTRAAAVAVARARAGGGPAGPGRGGQAAPAPPVRPGGLLAVQQSAGNRATAMLVRDLRLVSPPGPPPPGLARSAGVPLPGDLLARMERRFGVGLGDVLVHRDRQAARSAELLGAAAYSWGRHVVLGAGAGGTDLLAHELAHVVQQATPGRATPAAAEAAARAAAAPAAAVPVQAGPGVGGPALLRLPRSLTPGLSLGPRAPLDPRAMSYTELVNEVHEIDKWLDDHPWSSTENDALAEERARLAAEKARRDRELATAGRRPGRGRGGAAPPRPRALSESYDPARLSPAEVNAELDAVIAYLAAGPRPAERRQLTPVLAELRKAAGANQAGSDAAERQRGIVEAFTPRPTGNEGEALRAVMRTVEGIVAASDRPGVWYAFAGGRTIPLLAEEVESIRASVRTHLRRAQSHLRIEAESAEYQYRLQKEGNRESPVVSSIVQFFSDVDDPGAAFVVRQLVLCTALAGNVMRLLGQDRFLDAAGQLIALDVATSGLKARVRAWTEGLMDTAELTVNVLRTVRDASFAISISIGATLAAPALLAGGAGIVGTGAIVTVGGGAAGATFRGGSNLLGQALAGGGVDLGETWSETKAGARAGAFDAATAAAGMGARNLLGVGRATTTLGRAGRTLVAEGTVGGLSETSRALVEGESLGEAIRRGRTGLLSGGLGGAGGELARPLVGASRTRQVIAGGVIGGGSATAAAYASGDPNLRQAAIVGTISGMLPGAASHEPGLPGGGPGGTGAQPPAGQGPTEILGDPVVRRPPAGPVRTEAEFRAADALASARGRPVVLTNRYGDVLPNPRRGAAGLVNPASERVYTSGPQLGRPLPRRGAVGLVGSDQQPLPPAARPARGRRAPRPPATTPAPELYGPSDRPLRPPPAALVGPDQRPLGAAPRPGYVAGPTPLGTPSQAVAGARLRLDAPLDLPQPLPAGPTTRGRVAQGPIIQRSYPGPDAVPLPFEFPAFDVVVGGRVTRAFPGQGPGALRPVVAVEGGTAISIKHIDLTAPSYATGESIFRSQKGYVDQVVAYPEGGRWWSQDVNGQMVRYTVARPAARALHLELTVRPTPAQMDGFALLRQYAADQGVQLILVTGH